MTRGSRRGLVAAGAGFVLALAAVLASAEAASAHDQLAGANPGEGDTVAAASEVELTYSAALLGPDDETANLAQIIGPDGLHYETACATVVGDTLTVPVALGAPGEYTVDWRVVSSDGHPVSDAYTFTYAPDEGAGAAAGSTTSACEAIAAAGDAAAADDGTGAGLAVGLSAGAVVVGILVVIVMTGLQARKRPGKDEPQA